MYNADGTLAARYVYDSWGNVISVVDASSKPITNQNAIGNVNPIRYRGYYLDSETGYYYLQSRYYNPQIGRFLNADLYCDTETGALGTNMFAYCENNPVNFYDFAGFSKVGNWFKKVWNNVKTFAGNTFGSGTSSYMTIDDVLNVDLDYIILAIKSGTKSTKTTYSSGNTGKPISAYSRISIDNPIRSSFLGLKLNISNFTLDLSLGLDNLGLSGSLKNGNTTNSFGLKANLSEFNIGFSFSTSTLLDNFSETVYTDVTFSGWFIIAVLVFVYTGQQLEKQSYSYSPPRYAY